MGLTTTVIVLCLISATNGMYPPTEDEDVDCAGAALTADDCGEEEISLLYSTDIDCECDPDFVESDYDYTIPQLYSGYVERKPLKGERGKKAENRQKVQEEPRRKSEGKKGKFVTEARVPEMVPHPSRSPKRRHQPTLGDAAPPMSTTPVARSSPRRDAQRPVPYPGAVGMVMCGVPLEIAAASEAHSKEACESKCRETVQCVGFNLLGNSTCGFFKIITGVEKSSTANAIYFKHASDFDRLLGSTGTTHASSGISSAPSVSHLESAKINLYNDATTKSRNIVIELFEKRLKKTFCAADQAKITTAYKPYEDPTNPELPRLLQVEIKPSSSCKIFYPLVMEALKSSWDEHTVGFNYYKPRYAEEPCA